MGRTKAEKLFDLVSQGEVCKVRSFLRKHRRDQRGDDVVNQRATGRGLRQRTVTHRATAAGQDALLRVLLRHGARPDLQDSHGDTPLHLALDRAVHGHTHAFQDLVLPLLERVHSFPGILDIANKRGRTPRQLLKEVDEASQERAKQMTRDFEERRAETERQKGEAEWQNRLQEEWSDEMAGRFDRPSWDDQDYTAEGFETFDDWATRMSTEHRSKQQRSQQRSQQGSASRSKHDEEVKRRREAEQQEFQRRLREEEEREERRRSERLRKRLARQKADYVQRCTDFFNGVDDETEVGTVGLEDVPWPGGGRGSGQDMLDVLLCDVDRSDRSGLRKFVRSQQLLWHPDKFLQRCGGRLSEPDRTRILERVTLLSQALNQVGEEKEKSS